jgi:hypothetical protein
MFRRIDAKKDMTDREQEEDDDDGGCNSGGKRICICTKNDEPEARSGQAEKLSDRERAKQTFKLINNWAFLLEVEADYRVSGD